MLMGRALTVLSLAAVSACLPVLVVCRSSPPRSEWQRVDGSPTIENEFIRDDAICSAPVKGEYWGWQGIHQKARDQKRAHDACMAERGWILVPVESE